ncbi:MAG: hypothetical protein Q4P72_04940, partial [Eubacteriales bacterium]|nr:hypothetical protein [Eubacteriales bacterium]
MNRFKFQSLAVFLASGLVLFSLNGCRRPREAEPKETISISRKTSVKGSSRPTSSRKALPRRKPLRSNKSTTRLVLRPTQGRVERPTAPPPTLPPPPPVPTQAPSQAPPPPSSPVASVSKPAREYNAILEYDLNGGVDLSNQNAFASVVLTDGE